jgi:hypothetical protein
LCSSVVLKYYGENGKSVAAIVINTPTGASLDVSFDFHVLTSLYFSKKNSIDAIRIDCRAAASFDIRFGFHVFSPLLFAYYGNASRASL